MPASKELIGRPLTKTLQSLARSWTERDDLAVLFAGNRELPQIKYGQRNRDAKTLMTPPKEYADYFVIRTSPHNDAAICVYGGAVVWLEIAPCPRFRMPKVVGQSLEEAQRILGVECTGLRKDIRTITAASSGEYGDDPVGMVLEQWPREGERFESGYQPVLLVKRDPTIQVHPAVYLPNIEGQSLANARRMLQTERSVADLEAFDLLRGSAVAGDEQRAVKKQWPAPTQVLYPLEQKPLVILEPEGSFTCDQQGNCAEEEDDATAPVVLVGAGAIASLVLLRVLQAIRGGDSSNGGRRPPPLPVSGGAPPPSLRVRPERPTQKREGEGGVKIGGGGGAPSPKPGEIIVPTIKLPVRPLTPEEV